MKQQRIKESKAKYEIENWGQGYVDVNKKGHLEFYPKADGKNAVDLLDIVQKAKALGVSTPFRIRFPQAINTQIKRIVGAFHCAIKDNDYQGSHMGVFPYKVNQRKEFIDSFVKYSRKFKYGIEVGSKAELFASMTHNLHPKSLLICNGFKDEAYIELAFIAKELGKRIILVIEGLDELEHIVEFSKKRKKAPDIGIRIKLCSKGAGLWSDSAGERSKFGLTTIELLQAIDVIRKNRLSKKLVMIHYHIGSQIPEIRTIKIAITEAVHMYVQMVKRKLPIKYLNIGGGIGVDYDGSKTSYYISANYNVNEFASDVVFLVGEICNKAGVKHPILVTESGRYVAAYHSVIISDIREIQENEQLPEMKKGKKYRHMALNELDYIYHNISPKNCEESMHDAMQFKEDLYSLFSLGYLNLEERAEGEAFFEGICNRAAKFAQGNRISEDISDILVKYQQKKFLANLSIFNALPDYWALKQLFPIVPIHKHESRSSYHAIIVDITCDSEGRIDNFIDLKDKKKSIDLHDIEGNYYIGIFLSGAYQETLSMKHNLMGNLHEINVVLDGKNKVHIQQAIEGSTVQKILFDMNYGCHDLMLSFKKKVKTCAKKREITQKRSKQIMTQMEKFLREYTYLRGSVQ